MARRGPRGDLNQEVILEAAESLLDEHGDVTQVSLRMLAGRLGVTPNSLYTYFPSLNAVWHRLTEVRIVQLNVRELLDFPCRHCAIKELCRRGKTIWSSRRAMQVLFLQPIVGANSLQVSEVLMELCEDATVHPRDAHDMVLAWFFGSQRINLLGWSDVVDRARISGDYIDRFPRIQQRPPANQDQQVDALLRGMGITCTAS